MFLRNKASSSSSVVHFPTSYFSLFCSRSSPLLKVAWIFLRTRQKHSLNLSLLIFRIAQERWWTSAKGMKASQATNMSTSSSVSLNSFSRCFSQKSSRTIAMVSGLNFLKSILRQRSSGYFSRPTSSLIRMRSFKLKQAQPESSLSSISRARLTSRSTSFFSAALQWQIWLSRATMLVLLSNFSRLSRAKSTIRLNWSCGCAVRKQSTARTARKRSLKGAVRRRSRQRWKSRGFSLACSYSYLLSSRLRMWYSRRGVSPRDLRGCASLLIIIAIKQIKWAIISQHNAHGLSRLDNALTQHFLQRISEVVLEKFPDGLDEDVFFQALLQDLLDFRLVLGLENGSLLLEEHADAVEGEEFEGLRADDPIEDQEELFGGDVADEAVEDPWEDDLQRLDLQFFELGRDLFLRAEEQFLEQDAQASVRQALLRMESGREETVLSRMRQLAQIWRKTSQISSGEVEVQQKGAMQLAKLLEGRLEWMGANLSSLISEGLSWRMRTICPSCLSQMKVSQILRMASLKTKQTGFFRISFESDFIMCFQIFQQSANSTRLPEYSQKHSKQRRQTLTRSPLLHPRHRKPSISLAMFSPSTIRRARFSRSFSSESKSPPRRFSGWLRKLYFCLSCVYLGTRRTSCWKMKISESLTRGAFLGRTEERNWRRELESQTQVTLSSSSSYSSSRRILLAMLLNSLMIVSDHFSRQGSRSAFGSRSSGTRRVLFCRQLLIRPLNFSSPPLCCSPRCSSCWVSCAEVLLFLSKSESSSRFTCQQILLSFISERIDRVSSSHRSPYIQIIKSQSERNEMGPRRLWGQLENYYIPADQIKLCMQRRFSKEPTEQAEAKAVSNLLEIALKQQEDSNNWEERRGKDQLQNKNRTHSHFRLKDVPEQHRTAKNCLKHRYFISSREKPPHGDLANSLKEPASGRNPTPTPPLINQGGSQSIEGDFWLSKVNWMADASIKDHPSELRLHRKRSTGFQNHGKAARERGSRYQNPQRLLSRELKNNLAVNLSKQRVQVRQNGRSISKVPSIQEYVRETFDKIYERHHEENAYSPYKQSQQEKSTIVRKLLNNLESIKDVPARKTRQRVDPPYLSKQIKEVISAPPVPRRAYHRRDQRSILNLNEEAEKVYESRSINQFTRKDSASIKPK